MALLAYRHLLRAIRTAFQGDVPLITAARAESRTAFFTSRNLPPNSPEAQGKITHAREVARILRENVVQGQKEGGVGDVQGGQRGEVYRLRIHPEIERGDNDTTKNATTGATSPRIKYCSEK